VVSILEDDHIMTTTAEKSILLSTTELSRWKK